MSVPKITGAGICCLDTIVVAPRVARGDTTIISEYLVDGGGLVATALVACARLGAQAELISMVGTDEPGLRILQGLESEGVNYRRVIPIHGGESPISMIHVDAQDGERTIFHRPAHGLVWPSIDLSVIADADVLLIDDYFPELSLAAARLARAHGVPVVADTQPAEHNRELLALVDVLIAPSHFLRQGGFADNVDAALDAIHAAGPSTALITLGGRGWAASDAQGRSSGAAFETEVIDTLGAGDVFHGAFAYGLGRHWPTARCAEFASAVAALKCSARGARPGIPTLDKTLEFLRQRSQLDWPAIQKEQV